MSNLIIDGFDEQQIRARLDTDHWAGKLLAEIVCSTYWVGAGVDLREMDRLDASNWRLALAIMGYRRVRGWSDEGFWSLACWCRVRHQLAQWGQEG